MVALLEGAAREEDEDGLGVAQQMCVEKQKEETEKEEEKEKEEEEEGYAQQTYINDSDVKTGTSLFSGPYIQHTNNADMREQIHPVSASTSPACPSPAAEAETPASKTSPSPASTAQLHAPSIAHQAPRHQAAVHSPSAHEPTNLNAMKLESNTNIDALLNEFLPYHARHQRIASITTLSNPLSSANALAHTGIKPTKHCTSTPEDLIPQPATPPHTSNSNSTSSSATPDRQPTVQKRHPTPPLLRELSLPYGRRTTRSETAGGETGSEGVRSAEMQSTETGSGDVSLSCDNGGAVGVKQEDTVVDVDVDVDVKREYAQRNNSMENDSKGATKTKSERVKNHPAPRKPINPSIKKQGTTHTPTIPAHNSTTTPRQTRSTTRKARNTSTTPTATRPAPRATKPSPSPQRDRSHTPKRTAAPAHARKTRGVRAAEREWGEGEWGEGEW